MKYKLIGIAICVIFTSGCVQHLSQQQCLNTNWTQVGVDDGAQGHTPRNLQNSIKDCLKFNITVDTKAYSTGYRKGVKKYCSPNYALGSEDGQAGKPLSYIMRRQTMCSQNGLALNISRYKKGHAKGLVGFCTYQNGLGIALAGTEAPQVCTGSLQKRFMKGWEKGRKQFCNSTDNAFAIGKAGRPYPKLCRSVIYLAFKSEYDRGYTIRSRINQLNAKMNDLNDRINNNVFKFGLRSLGNGRYRLGKNRSAAAKNALSRVRYFAKERAVVSNQLYRAKVAG